MPNKFKVNLSAKKLVADWLEKISFDELTTHEKWDEVYAELKNEGYSTGSEEEVDKLYDECLKRIAAIMYNSRPSYTISEEGLKVWKDGQVIGEEEFTLFDSDRYWWAVCEKCGWEGSSKDCGGGHQIADTGDYHDCTCPKCYSTNLEGESKHSEIPEYKGIVAIPISAAIEAVEGKRDTKSKNKNMSYLTDGLTFNNLREANKTRLPQFKNSKGEPAHEKADGSDWSLAEWMNAVAGELGEAANIIKKIRRGDMTLDEARQSLADEFADIITYLDITAMQAGVNLGQATMDKFNRVSKRVNSTVRLDADGVHLVSKEVIYRIYKDTDETQSCTLLGAMQRDVSKKEYDEWDGEKEIITP